MDSFIYMEKTHLLINLFHDLIKKYEGKTILVTGATGMIGQNMVRLLLALNEKYNANIHIIAHGRNEKKAISLFGSEIEKELIELTIQDIRELEIIQHVDYIVHTANITGGSKQHLDFPMRTISTCLESAKRVLDIALKNKAKVIFLSSLEVYGFTGNSNDIYETSGGYIDCTNPRSSYSESKRMCECMFAAYAKEYGLGAYIARLTASFGYGVSPTDKRVFSQFAHSIMEHKDIVLKSTGRTIRNYCDAQDVATALLFIMANGEPGTAYNVANKETEISIKDLALKFTELFPESGSKLVFDLSEDATKLGYNAEMRNVLNTDRLLGIGWKPFFGLDEMITHLMLSLGYKR